MRVLDKVADGLVSGCMKKGPAYVKAEEALATVGLGGLTIPLPRRNLPCGPVDVMIRPESIRLVAPDENGCLVARVRTAT